MNVPKAVLFDLDNTLIDSSALVAARQAQQWNDVMSRLGEVRAYPGGPERIFKALQRRGIPVAVVTSSPRHYADAMLQGLGLRPDSLVASSQQIAPKPDPSPLLVACTELGVDPREAAYVGDAAVDHRAAASAGMTSIGALWAYSSPSYPIGWARSWPDVALEDPELLLSPGRWGGLQLWAEAYANAKRPEMRLGSVILVDIAEKRRTLSVGRYFTKSDPRVDGHKLSSLVLRNKEEHRDHEVLSQVFLVLAKFASVIRPIVTNVPAAPDTTFDRFAPYRAAIAEALAGQDRPDVLRQTFNVEDYKSRFGKEARDEANQGRFTCETDLSGENIILLDDVFTSGSQLGHCAKALIEAGAREVRGLTIAVAQEALPKRCPGQSNEGCPRGGYRVYQSRKRDGRPFWTCSRWCGYYDDAGT